MPWQRSRQNGKRYFTDPKVAKFKEDFAKSAIAAGAKVTKLPCTLAITCVMPIPAPWSPKRREEALAGRAAHTSKPDWDNLGKGISDALTGVAWVDDSQVVWANVRKVYGTNPRTEVSVGGSSVLFVPAGEVVAGGSVGKGLHREPTASDDAGEE